MKQKLWLTRATCLAYCIDKELYKALDYLREQVRVLVEYQEKQDKRIRLTTDYPGDRISRHSIQGRESSLGLPENQGSNRLSGLQDQ